MGDGFDAISQIANLFDGHLRVWVRPTVRRVVLTLLVRPRRVGDDDAVRPLVRQRWRLTLDSFGLSHHLEPLVRPIDAAGAVHVGNEFAEFLGLRFGGGCYVNALANRALAFAE